MNKLFLSVSTMLIVVTAAACSDPGDAADTDAVHLISTAADAISTARETIPAAVIRQVQVSVDPDASFSSSFHITDPNTTVGIFVQREDPTRADSPWQILELEFPQRYVPGDRTNLASLRVGPQRVTDAVHRQWPGCELRGLGLALSDREPYWYVFCDVPEGVVSATMNGVTGKFVLSEAPPARIPAVATAVGG